MKRLFIPAALCLAIAMPALAAPVPGLGPQTMESGQRLAQNDRQDKNKRGRQDASPDQKRSSQRSQKAESRGRQSEPQNSNTRADQRQRQQTQPERQQTRSDQRQQQQIQRGRQQTRTIRANQRQQIQPQRQRQNRAIRTDQRQRQQIQPQQRPNRTIRADQQRRRQAQRPQRYNWSSYQAGRRPPEWDRYRNFDRRAWQENGRAQRRYHWNSYQRPRGWYYRRWTYGMVLPSLFWGRQYWIDSYWDFGLPDPPYGYVWVRYGDDALLVNVETGDILRVIYGLYE